jgi:hypothetical protein
MSQKNFTYLVPSPIGDQTFAITQLLRKYSPHIEIIGVESIDDICLDYGNNKVPLDQWGRVGEQGIYIPSGAIDTQSILRNGDITLGTITLTQSALNVYDKVWMLEKASESNIPIPVTWEKIEDISSYPIFYKQKFERGGSARGIAKKINDIPSKSIETSLFQEFIESKGTYGVAFLADKGSLLTTHTHFESESIPKTGGSAVIIERFEDARLVEYTQRLVKRIDYSGWGLAEFKYSEHRDDYVFMEINAKFWASCEFAFINEPLFLKLLFEIDSLEQQIHRMIFLDRALARGIPFFFNHVPLLLKNTALRLYPGWRELVAIHWTPYQIRQLLKKLRHSGVG